jgi:hypothetical protein
MIASLFVVPLFIGSRPKDLASFCSMVTVRELARLTGNHAFVTTSASSSSRVLSFAYNNRNSSLQHGLLIIVHTLTRSRECIILRFWALLSLFLSSYAATCASWSWSSSSSDVYNTAL